MSKTQTKDALRMELRDIVNRYGYDTRLDTFDFIVANILIDTLENLAKAEERRRKLMGIADSTYFYGDAAPPLAVPVSSVSEHPVFGEPKDVKE